MRTVDRRLSALEQAMQADPPPPTPADIAATAAWAWRLIDREPPARLSALAGGEPRNDAIPAALAPFPDDALRALAALPV